MKKIASLGMIALGVLVAERVVLFVYKIWWFRAVPLDHSGRVVDGKWRTLEPAPGALRWLFGEDSFWIGADMFIVDLWQILAAALASYLLLRFGVIGMEAAVRREPIQPPQRNAGSRPSSNDSPASETPSSLGPRG